MRDEHQRCAAFARLGKQHVGNLPARRLVKIASRFVGNEDARRQSAFRNSSLQGAYFILAARALGLDTGPMSGFDNAAVDREFFADEPQWKSNFIATLGYGDEASLHPRSPRPAFAKFNRVL